MIEECMLAANQAVATWLDDLEIPFLRRAHAPPERRRLQKLNDFVREAGKYYPRIRPEEIRMVLIHSGSRILPEVSESLSAYALRKLTNRGVEVMLETRVRSCTASQVSLSNGTSIAAQTFLWSAGTAPSPIVSLVDVPLTRTGRIDTDTTMAVKGCLRVWAVGDSASIPDVVTGSVCPPTAQYALRQGKMLARNIIATMSNKPTQPFRFKALVLLAGLGRRCAVAVIFGL